MTAAQAGSAGLQAIVALLMLAGAAGFAALLRGCFALRRLRRGGARDDAAFLLKSPLTPTVAVLVVAREMSVSARAALQRLLNLQYSRHEVVLALDGPSENELARWVEELRLVPAARPPTVAMRGLYRSLGPFHLTVLDCDMAGRAASLNRALSACSSPLLAIPDSDAVVAPELLLRLVRPLLEDPDGTAAALAVAPAASVGGPAGRFGALESLRAWMGRSAAAAASGFPLPVPGCTLLIRREALDAAGGFRSSLLELLYRLHALRRAGNIATRVASIPEPVSRCAATPTFAALFGRALREQHALRRALLSQSWAASGGTLPVLAAGRWARPVLETAAYPLLAWGLWAGWADAATAGVVLLSTAGMGIVISMAAVVLGELVEPGATDPARVAGLFFASIVENLGYRQVRNLWMAAGLFGRGDEKQRSRERTAERHSTAAS